MPSITISAEGTQERYNLEAAIVTLGRGLESDIRLKDIKSSRSHCQVVKTSDGYKVVDLDSGNGTYLNGVQIKEQRLNPGDKIQIGATVIVFEDGEERPKTAQAARATASAPAAKATTSAQAGKVQTRPVPRPTTAVAASKAMTGKAAPVTRPATGQIKTGTSRTPKTGRASTSHLPKTTTTRKTQTATSRFKAEASRKKVNPLVFMVGIPAAFVVVVVVLIFTMGGSDEDSAWIKEQVNKLVAQGAAREDALDFKGAIPKYEEALKMIEGKDKFKTMTLDVKARIDNARKQISGVDEANKDWQAWKDLYEKKPDEPGYRKPQDLLDDANKLKQRWGASDLPWLKELQQRIEALQNLIQTEKVTARMGEFQDFRNAANEKYGLSKSETAQFGKAIQAWRNEFIPLAQKNGNAEAVKRAETEIGTLNGRAKELLVRAKSRLDGMDKVEAGKYLQKLLPQIEGSESESEIRELLKKYE